MSPYQFPAPVSFYTFANSPDVVEISVVLFLHVSNNGHTYSAVVRKNGGNNRFMRRAGGIAITRVEVRHEILRCSETKAG
jgi:hypothetical protein